MPPPNWMLNPEDGVYNPIAGDEFSSGYPAFEFLFANDNFTNGVEPATDLDPRPGDVLGNAIHDVQDGIEQWALAAGQSPDDLAYVFNLPPIDQYGNSAEQILVDDTQMVDLVDQVDQTDQTDQAARMHQEDGTQISTQNGVDSSTNSPAEDPIVCYGMIYHIEVKLNGNASVLVQELTQSNSIVRNDFRIFTLESQLDYILLSFGSGTRFGCLRGNMNRALEPLLNMHDVKFEAVGIASRLCKEIPSFDKPKNAIVHVDINIYGPLSKADEVGDKLTEHKLWLQTPDFYNKQYQYDNPHFIHFPDEEELMQVDNAQPERSEPQRRTENDVMQLVTEVNNSTHRAQNLDRVAGDHRLRTELLDHQGRALDFMLQRERGNIPERFRLWQPKVVEGREMFVHRITKTRSPIRPEEKGGGVLADEMGMGKSLSILALILNTIEEGHQWAKESNEQEIVDSGIERYTPTTLVIVPSALLMNSWLEEIKEHLYDTINVIKYHGPGRKGDPNTLSSADIVLTTYKTLAVESATNKSPLHKIGWFRIVLDEAHNIRHLSTTFHRSCSNLNARSRWCLTGTPIQNGLEDIGALFAFLKAEPFHSLAQFRRFLVIPFEQGESIVKERLVWLYDSLVLRRTKDILALPGQHERVRIVEFSEQERILYESTNKQLARYLRNQVGEYENDKYFGLFQINLQLRLLCNHGTHQNPLAWKHQKQDSREAMLAEVGINAERLCAICKEPRPIINSNNAIRDFDERCKHIICAECLEELKTTHGGILNHCPLCKEMDITMQDRDGSQDSEPSDDLYFVQGGHSTKMQALVDDVDDTLWEKDEMGNVVRDRDGKPQETKTKSIIFSCWTRTLNLIQQYLKAKGINDFVRIDGDCLLSKRQQILDRFSMKDGPRVMLMTTGTGAFGLNLTAASRIFIVELQWNPSVEMQAIARAIRIRQRDKVIVTRYMVARTVENQMKSQQYNKRLAAQVGFGAGNGDDDDLAVDENGTLQAPISV